MVINGPYHVLGGRVEMHLLQAVRVPVEREMGGSFFTLAESDLLHNAVQHSAEQNRTIM